MKVVIWRCTEACGNYYASQAFHNVDLGDMANVKSSMSHGLGETPGTIVSYRSQCPKCKGTRQPILVEIPAVDQPTPTVAQPATA
jgi:hypothetical protein